MRRAVMRFVLWGAVLLALAACASSPGVTPETRAELAPGGAMRAAINYGNPVLARKDASTGELRGVTVDLARELARRTGVALELVGYDTVARMMAGLRAGEWDVGFLAVDPARASELSFTAPYMEVEVSYLVAESSAMRSVADVDRAGVRISLQERNAADLFLSRNLKDATLVRAPNIAAAIAALQAGHADAFAANRQELAAAMAANPGFRTVEGRFSTIAHAAAVPAGRPRGAALVRDFIEEQKACGNVKHAIERAGIRGVVVAPPAKHESVPRFRSVPSA